MVELSSEHAARLKWFELHEGQILDKWPEPIGPSGDVHLLNKAKGIHKPKGLDYSTGIRIAYGDEYGESPDVFTDGSWRLFYHMELRENQDNPLSFATNKGLLKCRREAVPIGVLHQVSKNPNRYRVFGLGLVTSIEELQFVIEGPVTIAGDYKAVTDQDAKIDVQKLQKDTRIKTLTEIYRRRGQGRFRETLLKAYDRKCAVTGCEIVELLEAAHIMPHRGTASDLVQNGLLLRADIHTLFDLGLLRISFEDYSIVITQQLRGDPYYNELHGKKLRLPLERRDWPSIEFIRSLYQLIDQSQ